METYNYKGFTGNLYEISKEFNVDILNLRQRINSGKTIDEAIEIPIRKRKHYKIKKYTYKGITGSLYEIYNSFNFDIGYNSIRRRLASGMSIIEAIEGPDKRSKTLTYDGFTGNLTEISEKFDIRYDILISGIQKDIPIDQIIKSYKRKATYTYKGFTGNVSQISEKFGIKRTTLIMRLKNTEDIEIAMRDY